MFSLDGEPLRHPEILAAMRDSVHHRGPDGSGLITTPSAALGVERLRIVDPRDRADQPFTTPDRSIWLAGNGEIYNHRLVRAAYRSYPFQSGSDMEAALPTFLESPDAPTRLEGKFAIVVWRTSTGELTLMRDRAGENPLFYAVLGNEVVVASEIQALLLHPSITRDLDEEAVSQFFIHGYALEPRTMFAAVKRVEAGTICRISGAGTVTHRYWNPAGAVVENHRPVGRAVRQLDRLLVDAVGAQLTPGVATGVFCSGGIDSSLLAALTVLHRGSRVPTFAVKFAAAGFDESSHAADLAGHLRTDHTEVLADDDSLHDAWRTAALLAEPVADAALLPTILLAREAGRGLKVVMSGEGADELFGGYPTYLGHRLAEAFNRTPAWARRSFTHLVQRLPPSRGRFPTEFLLKRFAASAGLPWMDRHASWFGPGGECPLARPVSSIAAYGSPVAHLDCESGPMVLDYLTYLRDQLLVKVDRATMLHALEARSPYLDRAVTDFALRLPHDWKVRGFTTKWLLKEVARKHIPGRFVDRRKQGFSVPVGDLINGVLRDEADRLLCARALDTHGLLSVGILGRMLSEHRSGFANHARPLWTAMAFQRWHERWVRGEPQ